MISMKNMLITKQQPIATDLRMMMAALKFPQTLNVWVITQHIAHIRLRVKITDHYVLTRLKRWGN